MRLIFLLRPLLRLLIPYVQKIREGNPYALALLATIVGAAILTGFLRLARRPLGGDPDKPSLDEAAFRDEKNPYRI